MHKHGPTRHPDRRSWPSLRPARWAKRIPTACSSTLTISSTTSTGMTEVQCLAGVEQELRVSTSWEETESVQREFGAVRDLALNPHDHDGGMDNESCVGVGLVRPANSGSGAKVGTACTDNSDCASGLRAGSSVCRLCNCTSDSDCPTGEKCSLHLQLLNTRRTAADLPLAPAAFVSRDRP